MAGRWSPLAPAMLDFNYGAVKPWALSKITYEDGVFYHESNGTFFEEDGAQKFFTLAQGKEWTGGTVFDELVM